MISVEGLKVEFGVKPLFTDASFVINPRDRIALSGGDGAENFAANARVRPEAPQGVAAVSVLSQAQIRVE